MPFWWWDFPNVDEGHIFGPTHDPQSQKGRNIPILKKEQERTRHERVYCFFPPDTGPVRDLVSVVRSIVAAVFGARARGLFEPEAKAIAPVPVTAVVGPPGAS